MGIGVVFAAIGLVPYFRQDFVMPIPTWGWFVVAILFLFIAQFLAFNKMRSARDQRQGEVNDLQRKLIDPFLKEAHDRHLEHLKQLIEYWNSSLVIPPVHQVMLGTSAMTDELSNKPLFDCLESHLPYPDLWKNHYTLDAKLHEYLNTCNELRNKIRKSWRVENTQPTNSFEGPILRLIAGEIQTLEYRTFFAKGHSLEEVKYQMLNVNYTEAVRGLETSNQQFDYSDDKTLALVIEYGKVAENSLSSDIASKAKQLFNELKEIENRIRGSLQEILERCDYIGPSCRQCPIR